MSINVNGDFQYGTFFDEFPSADIAVYTAILGQRIALPADIVGITWQIQTHGPVPYQYRYNTFEEPNIRTSTSGADPKIPVAGPGAVPTATPGVWAWYVFRCTGAVDPGTDWSGDLEWGYVVDGEWIYYPLRSLNIADVRLADEYWSEFLLGAFGEASADIELESFRVLDFAASPEEIVAQTREFDSLYPDNELHYAPFLNVATLAPPGTNGADWSGTPIDGDSRPSYPGNTSASSTDRKTTMSISIGIGL